MAGQRDQGGAPDTTPEGRPDQRRRVLLAAVDAFAERGAEGVRLKDISDRVGMSPGHILYYFGRKDRVLLETLRWSETELASARRAELARYRSPWRAIERFVDLYLPVSASDPRWNLWAQVSAQPPGDTEGQEQIAELEQGWISDLAEWVARGVAAEAFVVSAGSGSAGSGISANHAGSAICRIDDSANDSDATSRKSSGRLGCTDFASGVNTSSSSWLAGATMTQDNRAATSAEARKLRCGRRRNAITRIVVQTTATHAMNGSTTSQRCQKLNAA